MEPPRSKPNDLVPAPGSTLESTALAASPADPRAQRWALFRDVAAFQVKLIIDGVKDLVLGPVSLVAAAIGVVSHRDDPGRPFRSVLRLGLAFDRWVNLFGENTPTAVPPDPTAHPATAVPTVARTGMDAHVDRIERVLAEQVARGGLTTKAKQAIDGALDRLHDGNKPPGS